KTRMLEEINSLDGMSWVTDGREVENYIALEAIQTRYPEATMPPNQFEDFALYLDGIRTNEGKRFERNKVLFAESILPGITKDRMGVRDLSVRLNEAISRIRKWNGI